jgi:hypothetical protein
VILVIVTIAIALYVMCTIKKKKEAGVWRNLEMANIARHD